MPVVCHYDSENGRRKYKAYIKENKLFKVITDQKIWKRCNNYNLTHSTIPFPYV